LIYIILGVAVGSAFFGLLRIILQHSAPDLFIFGLAPFQGYGQLFNRNYFASMLVMVLGLDLGLVVADGVLRKHLLLHLGVILILATSVVLTNSRGGIFAMMVQVVLLALLFVMRRSWGSGKQGSRNSRWVLVGRLALGALLICCLVIAMSVAVTKLGGDPLEQRLEKLSAEVDDNARDRVNGRRVEVWQATWRMIKANPLVGIGFGAYQTAIPRYHDASGSEVPDTAINGYLDLLSGGGLIGCAIIAWFMITFFWKVRVNQKPKNSFDNAARVGALAGLLGLGLHSVVDNALNAPINGLILTVLIVISMGHRQVNKRNHTYTVVTSEGHGPNVLVEMVQ
jgi:O-antigen ligase